MNLPTRKNTLLKVNVIKITFNRSGTLGVVYYHTLALHRDVCFNYNICVILQQVYLHITNLFYSSSRLCSKVFIAIRKQLFWLGFVTSERAVPIIWYFDLVTETVALEKSGIFTFKWIAGKVVKD